VNFSFGIITSGQNEELIKKIINSIIIQQIDNFEIIIVGGNNSDYFNAANIIHIPFDESLKKGWITRKKNLITQSSKFENIVYMHDYIILENGWYEGFIKFGNNFKIVTNKIYNLDNSRFRDWTLWNESDNLEIVGRKVDLNLLLPYFVTSLSNKMYISGAYWVAKKSVMSKYELNEQLSWGEAEDVEWSKRVRNNIGFKFNKYSSVKLLKQKRNDFKRISYFQLFKILLKKS
tara:strand:- start:2085 stop:2783 length:699 start_codon:yes stop_codon:yes gene_type:complete